MQELILEINESRLLRSSSGCLSLASGGMRVTPEANHTRFSDQGAKRFGHAFSAMLEHTVATLSREFVLKRGFNSSVGSIYVYAALVLIRGCGASTWGGTTYRMRRNSIDPRQLADAVAIAEHGPQDLTDQMLSLFDSLIRIDYPSSGDPIVTEWRL